MGSHAMQPIKILSAYFGDGNPIVEQEFYEGVGWRRSAWRKRMSRSYARRLRAEGVERVALRSAGGRLADFSINEILKERHG